LRAIFVPRPATNRAAASALTDRALFASSTFGFVWHGVDPLSIIKPQYTSFATW
jgi:hypothetical protein